MSGKPQLTYPQLQRVIKEDSQVIQINKKIENLSSKITIIWDLLVKASQYIDTFGIESDGNIEMLEKVEKENTRLYKKYKEYVNTLDDLDEDLEDVVNGIVEKYDVIHVNASEYAMSIAPSARGIRRKTKGKHKKRKVERDKERKEKHEKKRKSKTGKKKSWFDKLFA
jgi:hypothetical protein